MSYKEKGILGGKIALVTGASRGIGREIAKKFALEGATVIAVARDKKRLFILDNEIKTKTGKSLVIVNEDLKNFDKIDSIARAVFERYKRLDILVGAAAILGQLSPVEHITNKNWEEIFAVNVTANWRIIKALDPLLRRSESGRAIFLTCSQGSIALPFWGAYGASKAALERLIQIYAKEIEETKIRVNLIDPGPVKSSLRSAAFPGENQNKLKKPEDVVDIFLELSISENLNNGEIIKYNNIN